MKLDSFKEILLQQVTEKFNKEFDPIEARHISYVCKKENISTVIEYGVWAGLICKQILKLTPNIHQYHCIDAIPMYLETVSNFVKDSRLTFTQALLFSKEKEPLSHSFLVNPLDSIETSSILTGKENFIDIKGLIELPTSPRYPIETWLDINPHFLINDSYLKIDIDGMDISLVHHYIDKILISNIKPKAIQFELWQRFYKDSWSLLNERLTNLGYCVPQELPLEFRYLTICCTKNDFWYSSTIDRGQSKFQSSWFKSSKKI